MRQRQGGISRTFAELIAEFDSDPTYNVRASTSLRFTQNRHAHAALKHRGFRELPSWTNHKVAYPFTWMRGSRPPKGTQIIHHTYYSTRFLVRRGGFKSVSTIHDMIPEIFQDTDRFTSSHLGKRQYIRTSDLLICVSESTKTDLLRIYGDIQCPVIVVPNSVGTGFEPNLPRIPGLPLDYGLYIGGRKGYKDFLLLPEVARQLRSQGQEIVFVVVGQAFTRSELALMRRLQVTDLFQRISPDDDAIRRVYSNASLLVQTSRYEGFGMPPLEAMASGVPVVVADSSSMPEVGGQVAQYFTPGDAGSLTITLGRVLDDDHLRLRLGYEGVQRATKFSKRRTAELTAQAYCRALD